MKIRQLYVNNIFKRKSAKFANSVAVAFFLVLPMVQAADAIVSHPGRLLASNCFQCHGPNGDSVNDIENLMGEDDIFSEMMEMRADNDDDIMSLHAKAYTESEIRLISDYFAALSGGEDEDDEDEDEDEEQESES